MSYINRSGDIIFGFFKLVTQREREREANWLN